MKQSRISNDLLRYHHVDCYIVKSLSLNICFDNNKLECVDYICASPVPTKAQMVKKKTACQVSIPGLGRSTGGGKGTPFQYSCLENPMDRGAWRTTAHGVAKGSDMTEKLTLTFTCPLDKWVPKCGIAFLWLGCRKMTHVKKQHTKITEVEYSFDVCLW